MRWLSLLVLIFLVACGGDATIDNSADTGDVTDTGTGPEDADNDGFTVDEDCNDNDPSIHPFADEYCDDIDSDCDGQQNEDSSLDATTWYLDEDGDGFGTDDERDTACEAPVGYVDQGGDCDDQDTAYYPDAPEEDCTDPEDYNCDGEVAYGDVDEDGWPSCQDCNDDDAAIHPDAVEVCDGVDNDCDALTDDEDDDVDRTTRRDFYPDVDGDGFGDATAPAEVSCSQPANHVEDHSDCDDSAAAVNPDATEVCDGADTDEDCNGTADDDDGGVDGATLSEFWRDGDQDGYGTGTSSLLCDDPSTAGATWVQVDGDCDDAASGTNPGSTEICDGADTDEDCDGVADDDDSSVASASKTSWYTDGDGDGYGDITASAVQACDDPSTGGTVYATDHTDCDDGSADINPGESEICDASDTDEDCNGFADDDDPGLDGTGASAWYLDGDGDGYGDEDSESFACDDPSDASATWMGTGGDCDDGDADVNPSATEVCDRVDNDCVPITKAAGQVGHVDSSGTATTVTSTFSGGTSSSPASVTLSAGTYYFCDSTFYVAMTTTSDVDLVGIDGAELNGGGGDRILYNNGATVGVDSLTMSDGYDASGSSGGGGAIYCKNGDLDIQDSEFADNYGDYNGGALLLENCDTTISGTTFVNNDAYNIGGAVYEKSSTVDISDSTFTGGYAAGGGAFGVYYGEINITDTVVESNGSSYGGGVYISIYGDFSCSRTTGADSGFYSNTASSSSRGGAIYAGSWRTGYAITSSSCHFGSGATDNRSYEIYIDPSSGSDMYYNYGNNQTFTCTASAGCY